MHNASPYLEVVLCSFREQPWSCARQQSARILDVWDAELQTQWQQLKVEADRQLNATIEKRGYSASEVFAKEKPSTILKKIEIGTNFMKDYLAETMDGFLGREYEYLKSGKSEIEDDDDDDDDDDLSSDNDDREDDEEYENGEDYIDSEPSINTNAAQKHDTEDHKDVNAAESVEDASLGDEFIEIEDTAGDEQNKKPGGNKNKNKKKKGGQQESATVLLVHPLEHEAETVDPLGSIGGHGGGKPFKKKKQKQKKRKKQQHGIGHGGGALDSILFDHDVTNAADFGLLGHLPDADDLLSIAGNKKRKRPSKYGRSNGVTRGKKKKKKKALMKLVLLGSFLKAKIELLLKILGAHLQIKFFAIALIGLLINIARFWIDVKRGGSPNKVVYVEHAHHQHHYEDHGEDWGEQGGYWKRSLQTDPTVEESSSTDSYQPWPQRQDPQYLAYRNQWQ